MKLSDYPHIEKQVKAHQVEEKDAVEDISALVDAAFEEAAAVSVDTMNDFPEVPLNASGVRILKGLLAREPDLAVQYSISRDFVDDLIDQGKVEQSERSRKIVEAFMRDADEESLVIAERFLQQVSQDPDMR